MSTGHAEKAYVRVVEEAFLRSAGRGLMLSARDLDLVLRWQRAGYPLHVVTDAIETCMQSASARVYGLSYTQPAVEEAFTHWSRRREGEPSDAQPPPLFVEAAVWDGLLERLVRAGRAADEPARSVLIRR